MTSISNKWLYISLASSGKYKRAYIAFEDGVPSNINSSKSSIKYTHTIDDQMPISFYVGDNNPSNTF